MRLFVMSVQQFKDNCIANNDYITLIKRCHLTCRLNKIVDQTKIIANPITIKCLDASHEAVYEPKTSLLILQ